MSQQKPDVAFGLLPKKQPTIPRSADACVVLPWKAQLETADRRLRELEDLIIEESLGEKRPKPNPDHPWRDRV